MRGQPSSARFVCTTHLFGPLGEPKRLRRPLRGLLVTLPLAAGRDITRTDLEHRRRVAVLGDRLRRKLLGAHGGLSSWVRVFALLLAESTAVATLSGVLGSLAGIALIKVGEMTAPPDQPLLSPAVFDAQTTILVVVSLILVGVVAGFLPALRAARVAPAESLRAR
jgi:hypothetical protein